MTFRNIASARGHLRFQPIRTRLQNGRKILIFVGLIVYPIWFVSPALRPGTSLHLGAVGNDINLSIREAQALERMKFPWSRTSFFEFPSPKVFWRIEHLVDVPQKAFYWLFTRFVDPILTVNLYMTLGMILTGYLAYKVCRTLQISHALAVGAGVCVEALPALRQLMLTGAAANFNAVFPLLMLNVVLKPTSFEYPYRIFRKIIAVLSGALLASFYQFTYTSLLFTIWLIANLSNLTSGFFRKSRRFQISTAICFVLLVPAVYGISNLVLNQTVSESGKPYGIYSLDEVNKDFYTLRGFVQPDKFHLLFPASQWEVEGYSQQYGGLIFSLIAAFGIYLALRNRQNKQFRLLVASTCIFIFVSLGQFRIGPTEVPAAREFLRFVMIGNRRYAIAGYIAQVFTVAVFAYVAQYTLGKIRRQAARSVFGVVAISLALVDINPISRRIFYDYAIQYSEVRTVLRSNPNSGIYISPQTEREKDYYVFDYPTFRDDPAAFAYAAQGPRQLAEFMKTNGVDYVLALVDENGESFIKGYIQNSVRFSMILPPSLFVPSAKDISLQNIGDDGMIERSWKVRLLKVAEVGSAPNLKSVRLAQFVATPILEVVNPEIDRSEVKTEWATAKTVELQTEALPSEVIYENPPNVELELTLLAPPDANYPHSITVENSLGKSLVSLGRDPVVVRISSKLYDNVRLTSESDCSISNNPNLGALSGRPICFGISELVVLQDSD